MSQQINLLNPLLKRQRDYFSLKNMLQALGLIGLGSMLFYGYAYYEASQQTKQFDENARRYEVEQSRMANFAKEFSPQQNNEVLKAEISKLEKELKEQKELIDGLKSSTGATTIGFSEYMRAFSRQIVQGLWLKNFEISGDGSKMSLSGSVLSPESLPVYIQRLGKEKVMHGKTFSTLLIEAGSAKGASVDSPASYVEFKLLSTPDSSEPKK